MLGLNGGQVSALKGAWMNMDLLQSNANTVDARDAQAAQDAMDAANEFQEMCTHYGVGYDDAYWHCHDLANPY